MLRLTPIDVSILGSFSNFSTPSCKTIYEAAASWRTPMAISAARRIKENTRWEERLKVVKTSYEEMARGNAAISSEINEKARFLVEKLENDVKELESKCAYAELQEVEAKKVALASLEVSLAFGGFSIQSHHDIILKKTSSEHNDDFQLDLIMVSPVEVLSMALAKFSKKFSTSHGLHTSTLVDYRVNHAQRDRRLNNLLAMCSSSDSDA